MVADPLSRAPHAPFLNTVVTASVQNDWADKIKAAYADDPLFAAHTRDKDVLDASEQARKSKRFVDKELTRLSALGMK